MEREKDNFKSHEVKRLKECALALTYIYFQIPEGVNVSKEARLAISKAASVFVLYATSWYVNVLALLPYSLTVFTTCITTCIHVHIYQYAYKSFYENLLANTKACKISCWT